MIVTRLDPTRRLHIESAQAKIQLPELARRAGPLVIATPALPRPCLLGSACVDRGANESERQDEAYRQRTILDAIEACRARDAACSRKRVRQQRQFEVRRARGIMEYLLLSAYPLRVGADIMAGILVWIDAGGYCSPLRGAGDVPA